MPLLRSLLLMVVTAALATSLLACPPPTKPAPVEPPPPVEKPDSELEPLCKKLFPYAEADAGASECTVKP